MLRYAHYLMERCEAALQRPGRTRAVRCACPRCAASGRSVLEIQGRFVTCLVCGLKRRVVRVHVAP